MYVLRTDSPVTQLRFLPDNQRLLVGLGSTNEEEDGGAIEVWTLPDGDRIRFQLPSTGRWIEPNGLAVHPDGERCYIVWNGELLSFQIEDGTPLPVPKGITPNEIILSPDGNRLIACGSGDRIHGSGHRIHSVWALALTSESGEVVWATTESEWLYRLGAFLSDGERFITVDQQKLRIRAFESNEELEFTRYPADYASHAQLSPDGRHFGVIGYSSMYVFDTAGLKKPKRITGSQAYGNFVSYAFHPNGKTLAVIHGGPTLIKMYDLETMKLTYKFKWKLGPLQCVAFSPDGTLGAAGARDGGIVIWDVDE